jgi:hypothetical protein
MTTSGCSWAELEAQRPDLADAGRALLYQFGVGLAFLSTVRGDGGPRLHPICPLIVGGVLAAHVIPSPKRDDMHRDPRYAMHSFPCESNEDAFYLTGEARQIKDPVLAEAAAALFLAERDLTQEPPGFSAGEIFEFRIRRCLLTRTTAHGDWNPVHAVWRAP